MTGTAALSPAEAMNSPISSWVRSGSSIWGTWPQSESTTWGASGSAVATWREKRAGTSGSSLPQMNRAGGSSCGEPGPEALRAVGGLEVDLAGGGVEGDAGGARAVGAQELVGGDVADRGIEAVGARDHAPEAVADLVRAQDVRERRQLGPQEADQRHPFAPAPESHRRGEQAQGPHPARRLQPDLDRYPAAHRVADQVGAVDRQRVHEAQHVAGEELGVVGGGQRLRGGAEAGQVDRVDGVLGGQRGDGLVEGALGAAEAVDQDHVLVAAARR